MWAILLLCTAALTVQTGLCQEDDDDSRGGGGSGDPDLDPSTVYRHTLYNFRPSSLFKDDAPDDVGVNEEGREMEDEKYRSYNPNFNDFRNGGDNRQSPRPRDNPPLSRNRPYDPPDRRPAPRSRSSPTDEDDDRDYDGGPNRDRALLERDTERERPERVPLDRDRPDQRKYYYGSTPGTQDNDDDDRNPPPRRPLNPRDLPPKEKNWKIGYDDVDNYGPGRSLPPKKFQHDWMEDVGPFRSRPPQSGSADRGRNRKQYDDDRQTGKERPIVKSGPPPESPPLPHRDRASLKPKERRWNNDVDNFRRGTQTGDETTKSPLANWRDVGPRGPVRVTSIGTEILNEEVNSTGIEEISNIFKFLVPPRTRKAREGSSGRGIPMDPEGASGGFVIMRSGRSSDAEYDQRPPKTGDSRSRPRGPLLGRDPNYVKLKKPPTTIRDSPQDAVLHSVRNTRPRSRSESNRGGGDRNTPFSGPEDIPGEGAGISIVIGAGRKGGGSGGGPDRSNDDERNGGGGNREEEFQSVRKPWGALGQHHQHVTTRSSIQQQQMPPPNQVRVDSKRIQSRPPSTRRRSRPSVNNDKPEFEVIRHYY